MLERYYDDPNKDTGTLTGQFNDDGEWILQITDLEGIQHHISRDCWRGENIPVMGMKVEILSDTEINEWVVREIEEDNE